MKLELLRFRVENETDIVLAHKRAVKVAEFVGLNLNHQTTFATAVTEICKNSVQHAERGEVEFNILQKNSRTELEATISDKGNGIPNIEKILREKRKILSSQKTKGLLNAKRLVSGFDLHTSDLGTIVNLRSEIPGKVNILEEKLKELRSQIEDEKIFFAYDEIKKRNSQLIALTQQLKQSEEYYKTLTESLPVIIFIADFKGQLQYLNQYGVKWIGNSISEMNKAGWQTILPLEDVEKTKFHFRRAMQNLTGFSFEHRLKDAVTGKYRWHLTKVSPIKDLEGRFEKWLGITMDIHAQKLVEETLRDNTELKVAKEKLENYQIILERKISDLDSTNRALEQFAYVASHDLKEPLRKISAFGERLSYLLKDKLKDNERFYLDRMQSASKRMKNLIDGLLAFSKLGRGKVKFRKVDLNNVFQNVLKNIELSIEEKKARIEFSQLPQIEGDTNQLTQLFQNLFLNSLKYCHPEKAPEITINTYLKNSQNNQELEPEFCEMHVADNGIGFKQEYLDKIFVLFQRLHTKDNFEGTGIGLAVVKKVVENHYGNITAKSEEGKGSTFIISLPLKQPELPTV